MPIYEYKCTTCDTKFEAILKKYHGDVPPCPRCLDTSEVIRVMSPVNFRLYGSGFRKRNHKDTGDFAD